MHSTLLLPSLGGGEGGGGGICVVPNDFFKHIDILVRYIY